MKATVQILGGYGGVGKSMARNLLRYFDCELIISGQRPDKAESFASLLREEFPGAPVQARYADARRKDTLVPAFGGCDLVIVTATVPDDMHTVAEAALEAQCDLIDILVRGDVSERLSAYERAIREKGRLFITQAGFHPGLIAPVIRFARPLFDQYTDVRVALAMDAIFEKPESIHEIIYEVIEERSQLLENGRWRKGRWRDILSVDFSAAFGRKQCFPLEMKEILGVEQETGLRNAGVYAAGFGPYIDNVIFPLALLIGKISNPLSQRICGRLMFNHIKGKITQRPRVEMRLMAKGIKDQKEKTATLSIFAEDAYDLTALSVLAFLRQYFDHSIAEPGLYLMGKVAEEKRLFRDLTGMGIRIALTST